MIKIELNLAVSIYLSISLIILLFWVIFEGRKKLSRYSSEKSLRQCPVCFYAYIDSRAEEISQCPRCKTLHKNVEK